MALDWSKEISFSGLMKGKGKGGPKGKVVYPSKRYINLIPQKERNNDVRKVLPIAILVFLLVAAFVKFGIGRCTWNYKEKDFGLIDAHYDAIRDLMIGLL